MKRLGFIFLILLILSLTACVSKGEAEKESGSDALSGAHKDSVKMLALVTEISERITVEVLESPYTSGIHWVITPSETVYTDKNGKEITREDIRIGDTVEILYNGQVMMSYPPQIVALKIAVVG